MRSRRLRVPATIACLAIAQAMSVPLFAADAPPAATPVKDAASTAVTKVKDASTAVGHTVGEGARSAGHSVHKAAKHAGHTTHRAWNKAKARVHKKSVTSEAPSPSAAPATK